MPHIVPSTVLYAPQPMAHASPYQSMPPHCPMLIPKQPKNPAFIANPRPPCRFRRLLFFIVKHQYFSTLMLLVALTNCVLMAMWHWEQSPHWLRALVWANVGFVTAYLLELTMKVVALGPEAYW